jgi:CubicO group peptidase (beta-lactamase class C family)
VYQRAPWGTGVLLRAALPAGIVGPRHGGWLAYHPFRLHGAAYGGLVGPVDDAARFLAAHLGGGELDGARLLGSGTAELMRRVTVPGRPYDLGLGWFRRPGVGAGGPPFVEHLGGGLGVYNTMRLYPELDFGVVVMANSPGYDLEAVIAPVVEAAGRGAF